jgi:hypothetical protein
VPKITPQLPISGGAGIPALEISNEDWKMGESVCGQEISNETRKRIIDVTRNYMSLATLVIFAPSTSKSMGQIEEIKSAAAGLHAAIMKSGNLYARHMIAVHLKRQPVAVTGGKARSKKRRPATERLRSLALDARAVSRACSVALKLSHVSGSTGSVPAEHFLHVSSSGYRQGEAWEPWIRQLVAIFKGVGLPSTVRGDTDKNKAGPSAFVEFVKWLQACIPEEFRRSIADNSLARAIIKAKRAPDREPKA